MQLKKEMVKIGNSGALMYNAAPSAFLARPLYEEGGRQRSASDYLVSRVRNPSAGRATMREIKKVIDYSLLYVENLAQTNQLRAFNSEMNGAY